jgi:hypothetical protein
MQPFSVQPGWIVCPSHGGSGTSTAAASAIATASTLASGAVRPEASPLLELLQAASAAATTTRAPPASNHGR